MLLDFWHDPPTSMFFGDPLEPCDLDSLPGLSFSQGEEPQEVMVMGWRLSDSIPPSGGGGRYEPRMPGDGGGTDVGSNADYHVTNDDAMCEDGAAVKAANALEALMGSVGPYEFSGLLVRNSDGTYGLASNELSTLYLADRSSFDELDDYSTTFGLIHNHNQDTSNLFNNFINRYPSAGDWIALDILVEGGADPSNLSVFIIDPFGDIREFKYIDKAFYKEMKDSERRDGDNLPGFTVGCS